MKTTTSSSLFYSAVAKGAPILRSQVESTLQPFLLYACIILIHYSVCISAKWGMFCFISEDKHLSGWPAVSLNICKAELEQNCIAADINSTKPDLIKTFESRRGFTIFTDKNKKLISVCAISTPASSEFKRSVHSVQEMGSFSSLALGQKVIKLDQTPGTAHGPAIWTA